LNSYILNIKGGTHIYRANGKLVSSPHYSQVEHSQYSCLFLITVGMLIRWLTVSTVAI
jgi:hypothetical protein